MRIDGIDRIFARMVRLDDRLNNTAEPVQRGADRMKASIDANFAASGRPAPWTPLAESTLAGRRRRGNTSTKPLEDTGKMRGSFEEIFTNDAFEVGTNAFQANWLQEGTSRGIPPRPFVLYQTEDIDAVEQVFTQHIVS